ncbi:MAG: hypothetical protein KIT34_03905, partial [Cyanobacteria bacterium TGS_CYA1]|nr:hypothetical protein [Cyanobacteria bacterium TGS_CYA1]
DLANLTNEAKHGGKKIVQALDETVKELLTPAGDTGLGIKVKIPRDAADEIRSDTKSLMKQDWIQQGPFHRLAKTELGRIRNPYNWPVINERFSKNVIRQSTDDSCVSALGEMLSEGLKTESQLLALETPPINIYRLAKELGAEWAANSDLEFDALTKKAPWGATVFEQNWTKKRSHHVILVDGVDAFGNVRIRDSWEGTQYEMKFREFDKIWNGAAIYRLDK